MRSNPTMKYFFWAARKYDGKPLSNVFSVDREYVARSSRRYFPRTASQSLFDAIEATLEVKLNWLERSKYPPGFMRDEYIKEVAIATPSVVGNPNIVVVIVSDNTPYTNEIIRSIRYGWSES